MDYEKSVPFSGNAQKAMEMAQAAFIQAGYRITEASDTSVSGQHEGGFMRSQSGNTIYGASPVTVRITDNNLFVGANYEGIEKIKKFLIRLMVGMALLLGPGLAIPFAFVFDDKWPALFGLALGSGIPLLQLPIHLLITPWIIKKRATQALDTLVHNITMLAR